MDGHSEMDWQATPPAAEINAIYNPAMLERRRPRDEFEIPNMPGGWIDYYTERQFNVEDVVQFQHLAKPSIITCAKRAVGQAKRRCVEAAVSVGQMSSAAAYAIVRGVRATQADRRRRPVSPRHSPRHSPIQTPQRGTTASQKHSHTSPEQTPAPSPSQFSNLGSNMSFVDLNKTPKIPKTPIAYHNLAELQLLRELGFAASAVDDEPNIPQAAVRPVTPQLKSHPCYLEGNDSDFSSHVPDFAPESSPSEDPITPTSPRKSPASKTTSDLSPEWVPTDVSNSPIIRPRRRATSSPTIDLNQPLANASPLRLPITPHKKQYPSYMDAKDSDLWSDIDFSPTLTDIASPMIGEEVPLSGEAPVSTTAKDLDGFSSYVTDFSADLADYPDQPSTPHWHEEPAVSPYHKNAEIVTRRVTRATIQREEAERRRKEEQRQRNLERARISALTEEWEDKVCKAVRDGMPPDYKAADFARVVPPRQGGFTDSWLNDESVNGYLKLITKFHNTEHASSIPKSHAFPSFMLTQIAKKGYEGVARWAKRAKIGGKDLLQTHTIFIPVNNGSHWTLMVVYPGARVAHYYDSMGRNRLDNGKKWFDLLKIWLRGELGADYNEREWSFFDKESPQQNNSSDCGVFAITTAKMLILGADVLGYGPGDIPLQRKRIVAELVNGAFL